MDQIHRRLTDDQVRAVLRQYAQGTLNRAQVQGMLGLAKTRFFALLKECHENGGHLHLIYQRGPPTRLSAGVEEAIARGLLAEKALIEDQRLPISSYNYSALRDRLAREKIAVSLSTMIERAKTLACYRPRSKVKAHDREVTTTAVGSLVQHDASLHQWSPLAAEKWSLTTWTHIQAAQSLVPGVWHPLPLLRRFPARLPFPSRGETVSGGSTCSRPTRWTPSGSK
jgi:hypothetical protein